VTSRPQPDEELAQARDARLAMQEEMFLRDPKNGPDVRLELEHLMRNLSLDEKQAESARGVLTSHKELFRKHAQARKEFRAKTLELHRAIERRNREFAVELRRMEEDEAAWRGRIRRLLRADQQERFDAMMKERDRLEKEWRRRIAERGEGGATVAETAL
jgi:hypothetical protein